MLSSGGEWFSPALLCFRYDMYVGAAGTPAHPVPPHIKTTSLFLGGWLFFVGIAPSLAQSNSFSSNPCFCVHRVQCAAVAEIKMEYVGTGVELTNVLDLTESMPASKDVPSYTVCTCKTGIPCPYS